MAAPFGPEFKPLPFTFTYPVYLSCTTGDMRLSCHYYIITWPIAPG